MTYFRKTLLATAISATLIPSAVSAAGFGLIQHSAKTGGTAYAGTAATPHDPATVFFNPAGMTRNDRAAISGVVSYIQTDFEFEGVRSDATGQTPGTGKTDESGTPVAVHYMTPFRDDWAFGLSITTPFGSQTQYANDWVGRYHGVESSILAVNINPNIAYQINDRLSVGFGLNAQYFDATLSQNNPTTFNNDNDVFVEVEGDSWAAGVNAGVLFDVTDRTLVGLAWRSQVKQQVKGDVTATADNARVPDGQGGFVFVPIDEQRGGSATIELPESATLSISHRPAFDDRLNFLADATWTRWSRIESIDIEFDEPLLGQDGRSLVLDFQDSWRGALGATWDQTDRLQLRTGVAFDQSAVKDSERRTVRVPDNHRRWLSVGAGYRFDNGLELDGSYSRLFISDTKIDNTIDTGQTGSVNLNGVYDSSADIFTVGATYRF